MALTPPTGGRALVADPAPVAPPFVFATHYEPGPAGGPGPQGDPGPAGSIGAPPCNIVGTAAASVPLTIKGAAGQSVALQEWRDSDNALKASITKDGFLTLNATGTSWLDGSNTNAFFKGCASVVAGTSGNAAFYGAQFRPYPGLSNATTIIAGLPLDGASAVSVVVDSPTLATAGAKLLSIRNNGSEKAYFDKDGNLGFANGAVLSTTGVRLYTVNLEVGGNFNASAVTPAGAATSFTINGGTADSGSAVACVLNSYNAFSTAGAKLLSVRNATVEKAFIDYGGSVVSQGGGSFQSTVSSANTIIGTGFLGVNNGTTPALLKGSVNDGAAAVNVILDGFGTLSTAGSKLLSIRNNTVEKAYVSKDGVGVFRKPSANSIVSLTQATNVAVDASLGEFFFCTMSTNTSTTFSDPTNVTTAGESITISVYNNTGGNLTAGNIAFGASYKLATITLPVSGQGLAIRFSWSGSYWREVSRSINIPL
jgi:hypothetical protein